MNPFGRHYFCGTNVPDYRPSGQRLFLWFFGWMCLMGGYAPRWLHLICCAFTTRLRTT